MKNFALRFKMPSPGLNVLVGLMVVFSLVGFTDATYLTIEHFRGTIPPCSLIKGCDQVTTSQYSKILGIPVALLGLIYYLTVLVGSIAYCDIKNKSLLGIICIFTSAGLVFSLWFTGVQGFIIHAFCQYCLLSALTSTLLFITGMLTLCAIKKSTRMNGFFDCHDVFHRGKKELRDSAQRQTS